jgi:CheY-like chemotaxis protein/HD-like signal output (HDOD) protein
MTDARLNILFVDDERRILDGLRRQLHGRRDRWDMRFADSGAAALAMLAERPADVVVSDMRMPGMKGGELLRHVMDRWPQTARIILSGQTDQADLICDLAPIHQYIQKPCPPDALTAAIERTVGLTNPRARVAATRAAVLGPSPAAYRALKAELAGTANPAAIAALAERDPAVAAKLVQLASGAFFGMPRAIHGVREAVDALGVQMIQSIIVAGRLFECVAESARAGADASDAVAAIWGVSAAVGEAAQAFAARAGADTATQQEARLAGLMSLVGRAVVMTADPSAYAGGGSPDDAERAAYGTTQDEITAYLLGLWAFPRSLVEAVACQSRPAGLPVVPAHHPGAFVHLARATAAPDPVVPPPALDVAFVHARGLAPLLESTPFVALLKRSA